MLGGLSGRQAKHEMSPTILSQVNFSRIKDSQNHRSSAKNTKKSLKNRKSPNNKAGYDTFDISNGFLVKF